MWLGEMSDDRSSVDILIRDALAVIKDLDTAIRGNGGPGLAEHTRNNAERLDRAMERLKDLDERVTALTEIGNRVAALEAKREDATTLKTTKWDTLGKIAVALVAFAALAMQFMGG